MNTTNEVLEKIKEFEGLRLAPYTCPSGLLTIGYGHVITEYEDRYKNGITIYTANSLFKADIENVENQLDRLLLQEGLSVNIYQYSALVSFTFNCGIYNTENLITGGYTRPRTHEVIAEKMQEYCNSNGRPLNGLKARRKWESDYYKKGVDKMEITKIQYLIKPNYNIRETPSEKGKILICYDTAVYVDIVSTVIENEFIKTNRGYVHRSAFYDNFM